MGNLMVASAIANTGDIMRTPTGSLVIAIAIAVLGAWMLRRGWRGRRVGDHPHCRRCEFDLSGRPAGSHVCPECGADVRQPRAVAVGERHRRPWLATAGGLVLLCGIAGFVFVGSGLSKSISWERYKPVAWLIRDGRSAAAATRAPALAELLRRQQAGLLSARHVAAVVDAGLKVQGDRSRPWDQRWGDFVEAARRSNGLGDAQWRTYAEQAVRTDYFRLSVTPRLGTRGLPMVMLECRNARVGRASDLFAHYRVLAIVVDGREYPGLVDDRDGDAAEISSNASGGGGGTRDDLRRALRGLPPGPHSGYFIYEVRVTPPPQARRTLGQDAAPPTAEARAKRYAKQMYAERRAVWSDAGRESAIAVTRLQIPFQLELCEGGGGGELRGSGGSRGAARAVEPLTADMEKLVEARVAREADARKRLLSVEPKDVAAAAEMLREPDSGVIKLLPQKKYPQELLGMHGAGAYYDFARPSQHYRTGREMTLREGKLACSYGFFLELGDLSPTDVANLSETPPPGADDATKRQWAEFWSPSRQLPPDLVASLGKSEQRGGPRGVQARAERAYLFRSTDDVIDSDILVGLRVLRICDDGSAVIAYRILNEFERPGRQ